MKVTRKTPNAINAPLQILGVDRVILCILMVLFWFIGDRFSWIAGGVFIVSSIALFQMLGRKDPDIAKVLFHSFSLKDAYDPCRREVFTLEIVDDSTEEL